MGEIFAKRIFPIRCRTQPPIASDAKLKFSRHSDANRNKKNPHIENEMKRNFFKLNFEFYLLMPLVFYTVDALVGCYHFTCER